MEKTKLIIAAFCFLAGCSHPKDPLPLTVEDIIRNSEIDYRDGKMMGIRKFQQYLWQLHALDPRLIEKPWMINPQEVYGFRGATQTPDSVYFYYDDGRVQAIPLPKKDSVWKKQ